MRFSKEAKWIWDNKEKKDSYQDFLGYFNYEAGEVNLKISSETTYLLFINDKVVAHGQFAGYSDEKYFDEIDISKFCKKGKNKFFVTVWYEGLNTFTHIDNGAGLIFSISNNGKEILYSGENILTAQSSNYLTGEKRILTYQIGYSSTMINAVCEKNYKKATVVNLPYNFIKRPIERLVEGKFHKAKKIDKNLYDLGCESTGLIDLTVNCEKACTVKVTYGEYLDNGKINYILPGGYKNAGRDFSLNFRCKSGVNHFTQYFVRIAGRYLGIETDGNITVKKIGIIPIDYPVKEKKIKLYGLDKKIYSTCVKTLKLCMHNHYEDCPWREQSLYALDGRNQMLCGYYAFDGNKYQRENLILIAKGLNKDGLLELTYPARDTPSIPFFSLMYIVSLCEYIEYTNDKTIVNNVKQTVYIILNTILKCIDDTGLIANLPAPYWNFYEWSEGCSNYEEIKDDCIRIKKHDLILNCAFLYCYNKLEKYLKLFGFSFEFEKEKIKEQINKTFFDKEKGLYFLSDCGKKIFSQLGNSIAVLAEVNEKDFSNKIMYETCLTKATLSMKCFVYDALLKSSNIKVNDYILSDIRKSYGYMLSMGATSFWETEKGVKDDKSASLCHGWSAIPVYYYNIIKNKKKV